MLHTNSYEECTHSFIRKILNEGTTWDINAPKRLQSCVKVGITEVDMQGVPGGMDKNSGECSLC